MTDFTFTADSNADIVRALRLRVQDCLKQAAKDAARDPNWKSYAAGMAVDIEAFAAALEANHINVAAIFAMDKQAIKAVPAEHLAYAREVSHHFCTRSAALPAPTCGFIHSEDTRRRAAATRAVNKADRAFREGHGIVYADGTACEVHAFGHWYKGTVVRTTRTGSVVVRYTSGSGTTREKTVGAEKIRKP